MDLGSFTEARLLTLARVARGRRKMWPKRAQRPERRAQDAVALLLPDLEREVLVQLEPSQHEAILDVAISTLRGAVSARD